MLISNQNLHLLITNESEETLNFKENIDTLINNQSVYTLSIKETVNTIISNKSIDTLINSGNVDMCKLTAKL